MDIVHSFRIESQDFQKEAILELEKLLDSKLPRRYCNWDEIKTMMKNDITIGNHTISHINLILCSEETAISEISDSKKKLEKKINTKVNLFAYPYGKLNKRVKEIVKKSGFIGACSTKNGHVTHQSDLLSLERINIHSDIAPTKAMFACRILKFLKIY